MKKSVKYYFKIIKIVTISMTNFKKNIIIIKELTNNLKEIIGIEKQISLHKNVNLL